MKRKNINVMGLAFSALLCLFLVQPASAQRQANGGGGGGNGGGGSHPSGGGGGGGAVRSAPAPSASRSYSSAPRAAAPANAGAPQAGTARVYAPRQGVAPGQRGVSATVQMGLAARPAAGGYRSYPGLAGSNGVTRITPGRPYGGYYNAHGYYNSFYAPHLGFRLNVLPYGYFPFWWGADQFYYSDGLYYQYLNNQYQVVEPPVGAAINTLPDNAQSIVINGIQYYELNGVYYQPITKDDGTVVYQVAGKDGELNTDDGSGQQGPPPAPQVGDIVQSLPANTRTIRINGQKLYVSQDDYYYQDARDSNGNQVYKIVGTPTDEPGSNQ